jgi:hypothetical protein
VITPAEILTNDTVLFCRSDLHQYSMFDNCLFNEVLQYSYCNWLSPLLPMAMSTITMSAGNNGKGVSGLPIAISIVIAALVVALILCCTCYRRKRSRSHAMGEQETNASPSTSAREDLPSSAAQAEISSDSRVDSAAALGRSKDNHSSSDKLSSVCDSLAASRTDSSLQSFNLQTKFGSS